MVVIMILIKAYSHLRKSALVLGSGGGALSTVIISLPGDGGILYSAIM
jgi:hypothetical protein